MDDFSDAICPRFEWPERISQASQKAKEDYVSGLLPWPCSSGRESLSGGS